MCDLFEPSQNTSTSSSTTGPASRYQNAYANILKQAQGVAATPYNPATESQVAGFTQPQYDAFSGVYANQGVATPYVSQAYQYAQQGAAPATSTVQQYFNPYQQNVIDATQQQFDTQNARQLQDVNSGLAKVGALNGSGAQVAQALTREAQMNAQNPVIAGLYSQGYNQALTAAQADASRALQGAQVTGALGGQAQQYGLNDVNALLGIGGMQQQLQQQQFDTATANAQQQAAYPYQQLQWLSGIATGTGAASGTTTTGTQTTPGPSVGQQLIGAGLAGLSFFNSGGRVGYDSGGIVMPYAGKASYIPDISMSAMHGGGPSPSLAQASGGQSNNGMGDLLSSYKEAHSALSGLGNLGQKLRTATDPESGWSTTVDPSGVSGWSNYLSNGLGSLGSMFGFRQGGMVGHYADGGDVAPDKSVPEVYPEDDVPEFAAVGGVTSDPVGTPIPRSSGVATSPAAPKIGIPVSQPPVPQPSQGLFGLNFSDAARQGLLQAGLGIMASRSPNVGVALGEGGMSGAQAYQQAKQRVIENENQKRRIDMEAQRLAQSAQMAQESIKLRNAELARSQAALKQQLELANRPKWEKVGETEFGQPIMKRIDPATALPLDTPEISSDTAGSEGTAAMSDLVDGIESGKIPPTLTGLYKRAPQVQAALAKRGFDLTQARLEYDAAHKQIQSLNGPQMVRYAGLSHSVINTIDDVKRLADDMQNSGLTGYNYAKLYALVNTAGNTKEGQLASQYLAAVNTLKEEFANLAQGGYAPTEAAWHLADQQINANYGVEQLGAALSEVQRLLRYRLEAIPNFSTLGPAAENRYIGNGAAPSKGPGLETPEGNEAKKGAGWSIERME